MDRRYKESRFYNRVPASNERQDAADRLVKQYLSRFNAESKKAQNYGGSTGGAKSLDPRFGKKILDERSAAMAEKNKIFDLEGRGAYGARKSFGDARKLDTPSKGSGTGVSVDSTGLGDTSKPRYTGNIFDDSDAFRKDDKEDRDAST